jgi:hypothetical protein
VVVEVENTVLIVGEVEFDIRELDELENIELDKEGFIVGRMEDEVEFEWIVLVPELDKCELEELENVVPDKLELDCEEEVEVGKVMDEVGFERIALVLK